MVFAIEAPKLTNVPVAGQKVASRNFIFPPCVHLLHLGAKNTAFQWKYPEYLLLLRLRDSEQL